MAWKRGVQNNQAGVIRKGHIKEFLTPSSKEQSISFKLRILHHDYLPEEIVEVLGQSSCAFANFSNFPEDVLQYVDNSTGILYIHAHEHAASVIALKNSSIVPDNVIALSEAHRINAKVCIGELQEWTIYLGESFSYDAREGAIGDTDIRHTHSLPPLLGDVLIDIRVRDNITPGEVGLVCNNVDKQLLRSLLSRKLQDNIVSLQDVFAVDVFDSTQSIMIRLACIISEVVPEQSIDGDTDENESSSSSTIAVAVEDNYRGRMGRQTRIAMNNCDQYNRLNFVSAAETESAVIQHESLPPQRARRNIVHVYTSDNEMFPVTKALLRPCIALTSVVQEGRGKYRVGSALSTSLASLANETDLQAEEEECRVSVDVEACTFDRVLLYLEHEARGEEFKFDPLLATELHAAATTLKLGGLISACEKVLGSFTERVRRKPYRYAEIVALNCRGWDFSPRTASSSSSTADDEGIDEDEAEAIAEQQQHSVASSSSSSSMTESEKPLYLNPHRIIPRKRSGETFLILFGMVLDITRWLDEHPGGSKVIPTVALNVDSGTVFEIYHASNQSYLYLKEFYVGELATEDIALVPQAEYYFKSSRYSGVPLPANCCIGGNDEGPSAAYLERLEKVTKWRLQLNELETDVNVVHKSF